MEVVLIAQIYDILHIDFSEQNIDIITGVQNDTKSRYLDVYLFDNGIPLNLTGHEVRIYAKKPDGFEIFNNGEITDATNGRCQFELTTQLLGAVGVVKAEITLFKNNVEILTTNTFKILVTQCLRSNGSIESSNEYGALIVLFQKLYEAYDLMIEMVQNIGKPKQETIQSGITTMWQAWEKIIADIKNNTTIITNSINTNIKKILDLIGSSNQTGGSNTTGTIFSKLNKLLTDWNSTRANKIDNIYSFTQTSSNVNSNGILSEKLNFIIEALEQNLGNVKNLQIFKKEVMYSERPEEMTAVFEQDTPGLIEKICIGGLSSNNSDYSTKIHLKIEIDSVNILDKDFSFPNEESSSGTRYFNVGGAVKNDIYIRNSKESKVKNLIDIDGEMLAKLNFNSIKISLTSKGDVYHQYPAELIVFYR